MVTKFEVCWLIQCVEGTQRFNGLTLPDCLYSPRKIDTCLQCFHLLNTISTLYIIIMYRLIICTQNITANVRLPVWQKKHLKNSIQLASKHYIDPSLVASPEEYLYRLLVGVPLKILKDVASYIEHFPVVAPAWVPAKAALQLLLQQCRAVQRHYFHMHNSYMLN